MAFSSILETRHNIIMKQYVEQAFEQICVKLNDNSKEVRENSSWCLEKICEFHHEIFQDKTRLELFINLVLEKLKILNKKSSIFLCNALHFLAKGFKSEDSKYKLNYLSPHIMNMLKTLFDIGLDINSYDVDNNLCKSAFFTICSILENIPDDCSEILINFFSALIDNFLKTLDGNNFQNLQLRNEFQCYLVSCIEAALVSEKIQLNIDQGTKLLDLITESFNQRQCVYEEGLLACSGIATGN